MTFALYILLLAAGWIARAALRIEPAIVPLQRADDDWQDLGGKWGLRERTQFSQRHTQALLDRLAAAKREIVALEARLSDKHLAEAHDARALRVIRGERA